MKKKNPHSNTVKKNPASRRARYKESYFCMLTWRERPVPKETILELGRQFYQWAYDLAFNTTKPRPRSVSYWRCKVGLPQGTYNSWYAKHPEFRLCMDEGKELLGLIREDGMMTKELSEKSTMFTMHNYSEEWRASEKYQDNRVRQLRPEDSDNKMLQPLMLSADEFRKAIQNDKNKSR